mmetsp:Transcript_9319/g.12899  ORF Transcript_9319/g.12899 Transcript_9319/m.12899 type:complete len:566 (+) Transcript_9319:48-1745(+)
MSPTKESHPGEGPLKEEESQHDSFTREDVAGLTSTVMELDAVITGFVLLLVLIEWSRRRLLSRLDAWLITIRDQEANSEESTESRINIGTQYGSIVDEAGVVVQLPIAEPRLSRDDGGDSDISDDDDDDDSMDDEVFIKKSYFQDPRRGLVLVPAYLVYGVLAAISTARISRKLNDETSFWPAVARLILASIAAISGHAFLDDTPLPSFHWWSMNFLPLSALLSCSLFVAQAAIPSSQNLASSWDRSVADMSLVGCCVYMLNFISANESFTPNKKSRCHRAVLACCVAVAAAILRTAAVGANDDPITAIVRGLTASGLVAIVVIGIEHCASGLTTFAVGTMLLLPTTFAIILFAAFFDPITPGALFHRAMHKELLDIFLLDISLSAALDLFRLGLLVKLSALCACWSDAAKNGIALLLAAALGLTKLKDHALDATFLILAALTAWTLVIFLEYDDFQTKRKQPKVTATFAVVNTSSWTTPLLSSGPQIAPLPQQLERTSRPNNRRRRSTPSLHSLGIEEEVEEQEENPPSPPPRGSSLSLRSSENEEYDDEVPFTHGTHSLSSSP